ncbi:HhH-GPD domain-containing protein [Rhizoctonia solani AG-1 IA]|uniref:HhH-GPD domain-containing protein n=1 Tax=Thanatephorus cucumeris (strain AG1-IA) TaxID=983506 RepID=L8WWC0_THACA|nr:HhH-GPD domain-containing protein [Rhizoctonia solani AG-1 IA]
MISRSRLPQSRALLPPTKRQSPNVMTLALKICSTVTTTGNRFAPYFPGIHRGTSVRKRQYYDTIQRQNVADGTGTDQSPRHNTALIRCEPHSPYFENSKTPRRRRPVRSDGEETEEDKRANTQLKRRRLILRGVMPDEFSSPSSPEELSRALRAIKPRPTESFSESVCDDPWKIIIATTLLNKTKGKAAVPVFWELIERWPTPTALAQVAAPSLTELLRPLGTQSIRTSRLMRLSNAYVMHPPNLPSPPAPTSRTTKFYPGTTIEYRAIQQTSPIAHLPFVGPYAIDSFRIFSPALSGGGAGARVKEQLGRIACLAELGQSSRSEDDFDETPDWYNPSSLCSPDDEGEEWRNVWPEDKQLRRYLVWRWAIDGVEYNPEARIRRPADWSCLNKLIRGERLLHYTICSMFETMVQTGALVNRKIRLLTPRTLSHPILPSISNITGSFGRLLDPATALSWASGGLKRSELGYSYRIVGGIDVINSSQGFNNYFRPWCSFRLN